MGIYNDETAKKISDYIDQKREEIIADIIRLVEIPSVSSPAVSDKPFGEGSYNALMEMLKIAKEHGMVTRNYENYCGGACFEGSEDADIGFWGHLDVVPEGDNWIYEPYKATLKDGYMIARGASDNKGPTVATMYAVQCLKDLGIPLKKKYKLFFGCDEEKGMEDVQYYAKNYPCPALCITPDSSFPVKYAEKGILEVNLYSKPLTDASAVTEFKAGLASNMVPNYAHAKACGVSYDTVGASAHTAYPYAGVNALVELLDKLLALDTLTADERAAFELYRVIVSDFNGIAAGIACKDDISGDMTCVGSMADIENGRLMLHINIRYPVRVPSDGIIAGLKALSEKYGCDCFVKNDSKPNDFPADHPIVTTITAVCSDFEGKEMESSVMGGGTYARKLPKAFACGMGLDKPDDFKDFLPEGHGGAHAPDECLHIDTLLRGIKLFCRCLIEIDELEI